ncbi:6545_t:CDS:2 [Dentiscutata erythropus]|uniref:6545_t:CDS:1 n=1 Tax=Dentiscutata erythropus TaxID=1348616 RepID=A0A9N8ZQM8_9GLOM|nr:6545_t:CDS:2 [Dentiscutata erythropus]
MSESPERMPAYNYYRNMWWDKGEFNEKARWDENYEEHVEKLASIDAGNGRMIVGQIMVAFQNLEGTPAEIYSIGSTDTCDKNCGKVTDALFHPIKPADRPWPNLVVEVAYIEPLDHVEETLKYWLSPDCAHDFIIVKIDPVPKGQAWYYCIEDRRTRNTFPYRTSFEFGMQDGTGAPLNILQDQCVINISLRCFYYNLKPPAQIPLNFNDSIQLDFYFVHRAIILTYGIH